MSNDAEIVNWESLIASRSRNCERMAEDVARAALLERERKRERTPERKAQHAAWNRTENGRKSMSERGKRYRETEKGHECALRKSRKYYDTHKADPAWREHKRALQRAWKAKKREEERCRRELAA